MIERRVIRGILHAEETDEFLLIRVVVPDTGLAHWELPGGGVDEGESDEACLAREIWEETGFEGKIAGIPVWTHQCRFTFDGEQYFNDEVIYSVKVPKFDPRPTYLEEAERNAFDGFKWWTASEIQLSNETFIPKNMGKHLEDLLLSPETKGLIDVSTKR